MTKRQATISRVTTETKINLDLNLDGTGDRQIDIPVGFLSHMLDVFAKQGLFDLKLKPNCGQKVREQKGVLPAGL